MSIADQREPAVYVSVEDKTYVGPTTEVGRSVYGVILSDRGPHNRIVTVTNAAQYKKLFGEPNIMRCSQTHYMLDAALQYTNRAYVCRVTPADSYLANTVITTEETSTTIEGDFTFSTDLYNSDGDVYDPQDAELYIGNFIYGQVECSLEDMDLLTAGDWVYLEADTATEARQIISLTEGVSGGIVTLDAPYEGTAGTGNIKQHVPYLASSSASITSVDDITVGGNFVYHFYANGAGEYYNNLVVKCIRNYEMERMYTDDDGNPYYPYTFVDLYVYISNANGTQTLLEGPWTVSLIRKTPNSELVKAITTGEALYIEDVVNQNSNYIRVVSGADVEDLSSITAGEQKRLQLMLLLLQENSINIHNIAEGGLTFAEGTDGTGLFDASNNISANDTLLGRVAQAYAGTLTSVDGSIEVLPEFVFPIYEPDYIVSGGYPASVQYSAATLANIRSDCHHLADTGINYGNYLLDLQARQRIVPWNYWTSSLYTQYRQIRDKYTGRQFYMSPVYHAIQVHLNTDNNYFLGEPPCNIEKGAIGEEIKLSYRTDHTIRGDLQDKELNYTIAETDGVYFATQFTTWKRYSALKRQHIAKFVSYLHRMIPKIMKDLVQRKATQFWLGQAQTRINNFFNKYLDGAAVDRYACISSFSATLDFDKTRSELNIYVSFTPIYSIERIKVFLTISGE